MTYEPREIECTDCDGNGWTARRLPLVGGGLHEVNCAACNGNGWREETEDEANDRAADAYSDMCESEPPISMQERYEMAARQKRELAA